MALSKEQVGEKLKDPKVVILNVLSRKEFLEVHILGSENIPMTTDPEDFSRSVAEKFGKARSFVLYGERFGLLDSHMATRALIDHGLKAENYPGGIQEWRKAGLPVEGTGVIPAPRTIP